MHYHYIKKENLGLRFFEAIPQKGGPSVSGSYKKLSSITALERAFDKRTDAQKVTAETRYAALAVRSAFSSSTIEQKQLFTALKQLGQLNVTITEKGIHLFVLDKETNTPIPRGKILAHLEQVGGKKLKARFIAAQKKLLDVDPKRHNITQEKQQTMADRSVMGCKNFIESFRRVAAKTSAKQGSSKAGKAIADKLTKSGAGKEFIITFDLIVRL